MEDGRLVIDQPYNIAMPAVVLLDRMRKRGQPVGWRDVMCLVDTSDDAYSWAYLADGRVVVGHAVVRTSNFPAFPSFDLAEDLVHLDLADRLQRYLEGDESVVETVESLLAASPRSSPSARPRSSSRPSRDGASGAGMAGRWRAVTS